MSNPTWIGMDPGPYLPYFLVNEDPRPAKEQFNERYPFGRWDPLQGASIDRQLRLRYPGDPPQEPLSYCQFRKEFIILYPGDFVGILQPDGSCEVCRMD